MTAHDHRTYVDGCYRCDLSRDEVERVDLDALEALRRYGMSAEQRDRDNQPCPTCGGDLLRTDFTGSGRCHAPMATERGDSNAG